MSDRFFLDTNIFVYSLDRTMPVKANTASALIANAIARGSGVVSFQVVQEFFNVALRKFATPMEKSDAERYLTTVFRPLLAVHSSTALYLVALQLHDEHSLSWYDAMIVAAALEAQCTVLFTEDFQTGRRFGNLLVKNPFS